LFYYHEQLFGIRHNIKYAKSYIFFTTEYLGFYNKNHNLLNHNSMVNFINKIEERDLNEKKSVNNADPYYHFKKALDKYPFVIIIGKYDHVLGPRSLYASIALKDQTFIRNLLRDALNTKNKFVILDFNQFYAQVYKIEIQDPSARGGKQLYAIIILRDVAYPLIPILHLKRIGMIFHKLDNNRILNDDESAFEQFFEEVSEIYIKKGEVLPLESVNLQIRSGVNTIQGFCDIIKEHISINGCLTQKDLLSYIEMMLDSCIDIIEALEEPMSSSIK